MVNKENKNICVWTTNRNLVTPMICWNHALKYYTSVSFFLVCTETFYICKSILRHSNGVVVFASTDVEYLTLTEDGWRNLCDVPCVVLSKSSFVLGSTQELLSVSWYGNIWQNMIGVSSVVAPFLTCCILNAVLFIAVKHNVHLFHIISSHSHTLVYMVDKLACHVSESGLLYCRVWGRKRLSQHAHQKALHQHCQSL